MADVKVYDADGREVVTTDKAAAQLVDAGLGWSYDQPKADKPKAPKPPKADKPKA